MSREKQIEEMAKHCPCYFGGECCFDDELPEKCDRFCQYGTYAEILYNAGYRKQSEGKWIELKRFYQSGKTLIHYKCSLCGVYLAKQANFCPNCGAKMKGGAE